MYLPLQLSLNKDTRENIVNFFISTLQIDDTPDRLLRNKLNFQAIRSC